MRSWKSLAWRRLRRLDHLGFPGEHLAGAAVRDGVGEGLQMPHPDPALDGGLADLMQVRVVVTERTERAVSPASC